jgi:hypothetical protein
MLDVFALGYTFQAVLRQQDESGAWLESAELCNQLAGRAGQVLPAYLGEQPVAFVAFTRIEWTISAAQNFEVTPEGSVAQ